MSTFIQLLGAKEEEVPGSVLPKINQDLSANMREPRPSIISPGSLPEGDSDWTRPHSKAGAQWLTLRVRPWAVCRAVHLSSTAGQLSTRRGLRRCLLSNRLFYGSSRWSGGGPQSCAWG